MNSRAKFYDHGSVPLVSDFQIQTISNVSHSVRFAVIQLVGLAFLTHLYFAGTLLRIFSGENRNICILISIAFVLGLIAIAFKQWRYARWLKNTTVGLGLLGTTIGLIQAFGAIDLEGASDISQIKQMLGEVVSGMYVAFHATMLGVGSLLWLYGNMTILGQDEGG